MFLLGQTLKILHLNVNLSIGQSRSFHLPAVKKKKKKDMCRIKIIR